MHLLLAAVQALESCVDMIDRQIFLRKLPASPPPNPWYAPDIVVDVFGNEYGAEAPPPAPAPAPMVQRYSPETLGHALLQVQEMALRTQQQVKAFYGTVARLQLQPLTIEAMIARIQTHKENVAVKVKMLEGSTTERIVQR